MCALQRLVTHRKRVRQRVEPWEGIPPGPSSGGVSHRAQFLSGVGVDGVPVGELQKAPVALQSGERVALGCAVLAPSRPFIAKPSIACGWLQLQPGMPAPGVGCRGLGIDGC